MRRSLRPLLLAAVLACAAGFGLAAPARDVVLYNHSPSVPLGFYVRTEGALERGAFVTVRARDVAPQAARAHGFEDNRDRFIKRIAALGGDRVCALEDHVTISGGVEVARRAVDRAGRPLPAWDGCRVLGADELLLLGDTAESYDGRYWGPVDIRLVEGVWRPLRADGASGA